jgi:nucleotide-binding universal stress UspA family protein
MKILCGTDFSPNAADALTTAVALARRFQDTLELVHATNPPLDDGLTPDVWNPVETALRTRLEGEKAALEGTGLEVRTRVELGAPAEVLRRLAKPGSTRLIVLSSIGRVALARVLLGSTADRVAEAAAVPTLVVRQAMVFRNWLDGRRPLRVLVAVDFTAASDAALGFLRELATAGPCEIVVGYLANPDEEQERLGLIPTEPGALTTVKSALERDLTERASGSLGDLPFRVAVEPSHLESAPGLIELAREHRADLIVTGSHQHQGLSRLWHQSTSRALLADAPMNVAVVPVRAAVLTRARIPTLTRVLVATDFSALGDLAIPAACGLVAPGGALRMLHVVPPVEATFSLFGGKPGRPAISPGEHQQLIRHAHRKLGGLFPAEAARRGITPEVVVAVDDDVPTAIVHQARQFGAHAICLSSHGRGAAKSTLFGSVAEKVIRQSHRPIHIVRPPRP